jgi:manganese oxidase
MFHHMMNFMSTMVGPMGSHTVQGMRAGQSPTGGMGIATGGSALSSEAFGPSLGRSMGEQTGMDRTVGNMTVMPPGGGHGMGHSAGGRRVPGSPVGMLDMPAPWSEEQIRKLNKRETRGMRADWYTGVEGLFTVVRILPPDLYDAVMSGEGDIRPGASIPGGEPAQSAPSEHHHHPG